MSVEWRVWTGRSYHDVGDDTVVKLEMALQSNTKRVPISATESGLGYDLDIDLEKMSCLQKPDVNLYRRQSPHLNDKWFVYNDPHDPEGADIEVHDNAADLLTIAQDAGFSAMTYFDMGFFHVDLKKMRVRRLDGDRFDEKYILRVQPPLEAQDDDDDDTTPRCPISLMPMVEPVVAADGHTYEKRQLQRWLIEKCTSPMTNEPMVPWMTRNITLETLVNKKRAADDALEMMCIALEKKRSRAAPGASVPSVDQDEIVGN